jgi:hypothetical protein
MRHTRKIKYDISDSKIKNFLRNMTGKMNNCPYRMNLLKDGSKSGNDAGLRISENLTNEDFEFYEAFMSGDTNEITLLRGIQSLSSNVASGSLGLSREQSEKMFKHVAPEFIVKF